jgi:hypothetical protein
MTAAQLVHACQVDVEAHCRPHAAERHRKRQADIAEADHGHARFGKIRQG